MWHHVVYWSIALLVSTASLVGRTTCLATIYNFWKQALPSLNIFEGPHSDNRPFTGASGPSRPEIVKESRKRSSCGSAKTCPKIKNLLMPLFLMGCFPVDFQEAKRPLRTKSVKRPIKVGKRPINEGKRPIKAKVLVSVSVGCLMGCFRAPPPWQKTAPPKRPIKRSMSKHTRFPLFRVFSGTFLQTPKRPLLRFFFDFGPSGPGDSWSLGSQILWMSGDFVLTNFGSLT